MSGSGSFLPKGYLQSKKIAVQKNIGKYLAFHGGVLLPLGLLQHSMHTAQCMYAYPSLHVQILFFFKFLCVKMGLCMCVLLAVPLKHTTFAIFF